MQLLSSKTAFLPRILGFSILFALSWSPQSLRSVPLTEQQVRSAVETWVRLVTADAKPNALIDKMEPHRILGRTVGYIAHLRDGGFCLCGADDLVLPVYLYSPGGPYDSQNSDCQYILWEIEVRTEHLTRASETGSLALHRQALLSRAAYWKDLIAGIVPQTPKRDNALPQIPNRIELGLTSRWHQGSPYNDRCPELTPGADEHAVAGCVATAMSQLMYYWKWPDRGVGAARSAYRYWWRSGWVETPLTINPGIPAGHPWWAGRLEWTAASGGRLRINGYWDQSLYAVAVEISSHPLYQNAFGSLWNTLNPGIDTYDVNFGASTYNWSIMRDTHSDPPDAGAAEVAKLCYHAGVAVNMDYGVVSSGSLLRTELEAYFQYDHDAYLANSDLGNTLIRELQWLRPVPIGGWSADGLGHMWIVYGYNTGTTPPQFKMNMGWGGNSGWYSLDNVPGGLVLNQEIIAQLAPQGVVQFVGNNQLGDGSPNEPYLDLRHAVAMAPNGATLIFRAGSLNSVGGFPLTINRPMTLKGHNVIIE